jgi:hypothetical protein
MWVANQIMQLGHNEDISSPNIHTQEEYMEEDINMGENGQGDPHAPTTEIQPRGSGAPPTRATVEGTTTASAPSQAGTMPTGVTRLRFGTPEPPRLFSSRREEVQTQATTLSNIKTDSHPSSSREQTQGTKSARIVSPPEFSEGVRVGRLKLKRGQRKRSDPPYTGDSATTRPPRTG